MEIIPNVICYRFNQSFAVSAPNAYHWCTDFTPEDHTLMGEDNAERQVMNVTNGTLILKEIFHTNSDDIEKLKLLHLYPDQLSWVSTHLTGPNKYSQFIYKVLEKGDNASYLNFTARHIEHQKEIMSKKDIQVLADKLCQYDSKIWKLLAKAMEKEFNK